VPDEPPRGAQPVGWPLPQTQALVLADGDRLCGIGEPGEIAVRTPFRSLGYLDNRSETARRFIANPFRDDPDDLVYLTGDRGAYAADGTLIFLGRLDDQVKLRGVRIEPAEVASALQTSADVAACAVLARTDESGEAMLVAYIVPRPGAGENASRLPP
jgi:acyl-coenzyme A synthetase/AMP-(fatty) acid ligase